MQFPIKSSTPQFHTAPSLQHKDYTISTPKTPQFQIKNPWVQHNPHFNTPPCSKPKTTQFNIENPSIQHTPQFNNKNSLVPLKKLNWRVCWTEFFFVLTWKECWTEGSLVLNRGVCWTEGFWGLKTSGSFVLNWWVELRGTHKIQF